MTASDLAVGARVPHVRPGVGVVVTQNRTDPRIGAALLTELDRGSAPSEALAAVSDANLHLEWRQLGVLDAAGRWDSWTGRRAWPVAGALGGQDCLAIGNMLAGDEVLPAMLGGFDAAPGALASRLLAGITAGQRAGGETGTLRSAALLVGERESFPLVDLRIDAATDPLDALLELWREYEPRMRDFVIRALDPDAAHGSSTNT